MRWIDTRGAFPRLAMKMGHWGARNVGGRQQLRVALSTASKDTGPQSCNPRVWVSLEVHSPPELADDSLARLMPNCAPPAWGRGHAGL